MAVPFVYDARLPDAYFRALKAFSWPSLQIFDLFPASGVGSLTAQLSLVGWLPIAVITLALLAGVGWAWVSDCLRAQERVPPPLQRLSMTVPDHDISPRNAYA